MAFNFGAGNFPQPQGYLEWFPRTLESYVYWEEFRVDVVRYNPSLRENHGRFLAGQTYLLPELKRFDADYGIEPEVVWDRPIMGFAGDCWSCWQRYVRAKVVGLTWEGFLKQVGVRNPHLAEDGFGFYAAKSYLMPRDPDQEVYTRVAFSNATGRYRFAALPPGRYKIEVTADGCEPRHDAVMVWADQILDLELECFPAAPGAIAFAAGPEPANVLIGVRGTDFVRGGAPFRFIGVNLRGLAHYGTPQYPFASQHDQWRQVREMGANVVRIFLPHKDVPADQVRSRLEGLLKVLREEFPEIYLIVALTDLYVNSQHFPMGDDIFYKTRPDGWTLLSAEWFEGGYKTNYSMAQRIKELDPTHLVTTGMMSTRHAGLLSPGQHKLYGSPHIDFLTSHIHNADYGDDDSALAAELKKPYLVEEAGFDARPGDDRADRIHQDMERMFGRGACGYMQWGFMAGGDNNDGDKDRGMD